MEDVDVAFAEEWKFDHGIMVPLHFLTPRFDLPVIPANINCQGPPLTPLQARLGVRRGAAARRATRVPERIALVGTGGISHWPATPDSGKINEAWDRDFLDRWTRNDRAALLAYSDEQTYRDAGQGGFEIRTFIAVAAAARGHGELRYYAPIPIFSVGCTVATMAIAAEEHEVPHVVIQYSANLDPEANIGALCKSLAEVIVAQRDGAGARIFPIGGTRVLAYPTPRLRGRRRRARPRVRVPQHAHRGRPRARARHGRRRGDDGRRAQPLRRHLRQPRGRHHAADRRRRAGLRRQAQQPASAVRRALTMLDDADDRRTRRRAARARRRGASSCATSRCASRR